MMRVPGRKDTGVIFTTGTELPPNERVERSERERPSGSGLLRSKDETAGSQKRERERERAGRGPEDGDIKRRRRGGKGEKRQQRMEIPENTQKQPKNEEWI